MYPKDPTAKQAQEILEVLYNLKHPSESTGNSNSINQKDTFLLDLSAKHYVIIVSADNAETTNAFKGSLADFNTNFYGLSNLEVANTLFGSTDQITTVKSFANAEEALRYVANLKNDKSVFVGKVKLDDFTIVAISAENLPLLYRKKQISFYTPFYADHYKK